MILKPSRRQITLALGTLTVSWNAASGADLPPTEAQSDGPFYKEGAPVRDNLVEPGLGGTPLIVTGRVLNTKGDPVGGATLDLWEANMQGKYDTVGYTLRGKLNADRQGRYRFRTLVPKAYETSPGHYRTAHIHIKVSGPSHQLVTTELYVKGDAHNAADSMYRPTLHLELEGTPEGKKAAFDFVLRTA